MLVNQAFSFCLSIFVVSVYPAKRRNRHSVAGSQFMSGRVVPLERAPVRRSNTMPPNLGNSGILGRIHGEERSYAGNIHVICSLVSVDRNVIYSVLCWSVQVGHLIPAWCGSSVAIITGSLWRTRSLWSATGKQHHNTWTPVSH